MAREMRLGAHAKESPGRGVHAKLSLGVGGLVVGATWTPIVVQRGQITEWVGQQDGKREKEDEVAGGN